RLLVAGCRAGAHGELLGLDLDLGVRVRLDVPVPGRVLRRTAHRCDDEVVVGVTAEDQCGRARFVRAATGRREQQDRHPVPDVADLAAALPVASYVLRAAQA